MAVDVDWWDRKCWDHFMEMRSEGADWREYLEGFIDALQMAGVIEDYEWQDLTWRYVTDTDAAALETRYLQAR